MTSNSLKPPLVAYSTKNKALTPNFACQSFFSPPYEPLHLDHHDTITPNRPTKESLGPLFLPSTADTSQCKGFTADYSLTIGSNLSTNDSQDDNNGPFDNLGFNFAPKSSSMRKPGFKNKMQQPMMVPSTSLLKKSGTSKDLLGQFGSLIPDQSVSARLKPTARKLDYDSSDDENDNFKAEEQDALKSLIPIKSMSFPESKLFQIQEPQCLYTEYKASYFSQNDNKSRFERDYTAREILDTHSPITIYKCKHAHDGQEYIIKCLDENLTTQDRLNNTWHLLNQLQGQSMPENLIKNGESQVNHHLVRYYNAWREDGKLYIVLEFCTGGNLLDVMQRGQGQSEAEIIKILTDISTALQPLHQQNIVHGHIKPENILLSRSGKYKLGDLALANLAFTIKNHHNSSDYITMENAKYYFSPEHEDIYQGKISPSDKADVYSLGLVLSQLMLGTDLRNNLAAWKELTSRNFDKLDKLESYSNQLKEIVKRMLSHKAMERPSVKDLVDRYGMKSPRKVFIQEKEHNKEIKSDIAKLRAQLGLKRKKSS